MNRCAVFWALVLSTFSIARAQQPGTIAGAVTSQQTGAPLAGASITIPGTKLGATTGFDGRYTMREVPAGTYRVQARLIGYGTAQDTGVVVTAGDTALAHFHLQAQAIQLDAVVAIGYATVQKRDVTGAVASHLLPGFVHAPQQRDHWKTKALRCGVREQPGLVVSALPQAPSV